MLISSVYLLRGMCLRFALLIVLVPITKSAEAQSQQYERRNQLNTPGLTIESVWPTARVNAMQMHNGRLYMAGQDHVVRAYDIVDGDIDPSTADIYRWPSWQETRGSINTLSFSRDGRMAFGGLGLKNGMVQEVDLRTKKVVRHNEELLSAISALEHDDGGALWIGTLSGEVARLDDDGTLKKYESGSDRSEWVRLISHSDSGVGAVLRNGSRLTLASGQNEFAKTPSPQASLIVTSAGASTHGVILTSQIIASAGQATLNFWERTTSSFSQATASNSRVFRGVHFGKYSKSWLVVAESLSSDSSKLSNWEIFRLNDSTRNLDLVARISEGMVSAITETSEHTIVCATECPVSVLKIDRGRTSIVSSVDPIEALRWDSYPESITWTQGKQRKTFDLKNRFLTSRSAVRNNEREELSEANGFRAYPDINADFRLNLKTPQGLRAGIPLDSITDRFVTGFGLWDFGADRAILGVGHQWGATLVTVNAEGESEKLRKCIGHRGSVTSLALSQDKRFLLTGGTDGSIACFSTRPWRFNPTLGASFERLGNSIVVKDIDDGSPAWESGLRTGDEVDELYIERAKVDSEAIVESLKNSPMGVYLWFRIRRGEEQFHVSTQVLQRPIWKLYVRGTQWILWRWRDYFYECSAEGDKLLGWQITTGLDETPRFLLAEQARDRFCRADKLDELFDLIALSPNRAATPDLIPPSVSLKFDGVKNSKSATVSLDAAENAILNGEPTELSLWLNDFRIARWPNPQIGTEYFAEVSFSALRSGNNKLIARAYSSEQVRGDSDAIAIEGPEPAGKPTLWGLNVGIRDYGNTRRVLASKGVSSDNGVQDLLYTVKDAQALNSIFASQEIMDSAFGSVRIAKPLIEKAASSENIVAAIADAAKRVRPNDWFILSLSGHGWTIEADQNRDFPQAFVFVTANTDLSDRQSALATSLPVGGNTCRSDSANLSFSTLFDALGTLPCHKMVIVDACQSAGATEVIRGLTPDLSVGPVVLVASQKNQFSFESFQKTHGVLTAAILEALGPEFDLADSKPRDGFLSPQELFDYCKSPEFGGRGAVQRIFENGRNAGHFSEAEAKFGQEPDFFSPFDVANTPLFSRPSANRK